MISQPVIPRIPPILNTTGPVTASYSNGTLQITLDFADLPSAPANDANLVLMAYDTVVGGFFKVPPSALMGVPGPVGPQGSVGPIGPQGQAGPQGPTGSSVPIKGTVSTSSALPSTGNTQGDGYLAADTGHLWVYSNSTANGSVNGFVDVGLVRGPAGAAGAVGPQGPAATTGTTQPQADNSLNLATTAYADRALTNPFAPPTIANTIARPFLLKGFERRSVLDFIPPALHAGIEAGTDTTDLSTYLAAAAALSLIHI